MNKLWKWFLKGIALIAPVAITIALLVWLGSWAEDTFGVFIQSQLPEGLYFKGLGVITGIVFTLLVGLLANIFFVKWLLRTVEHLLNRIPLVKSLYQAFKDIASLFANDEENQMGKAVAVDINGLRLVGFVMQEDAELPGEFEADDRVAVYLPLSYQIGGYTVHVRRNQVTPLNVPADQAMRAVLTGGALVSEKVPEAAASV